MILSYCLLHYHRQQNKAVGADFDTSFERGLVEYINSLATAETQKAARYARAAFLNSYIQTSRDRVKIIIGEADTPDKRRLALVQAMRMNEEMSKAADELEMIANG